MKKILVWLLFLSLIVSLASANNRQLFDSANKYYSEKDFERAIILYEEILGQGLTSSELYYNLGNAYYRSNKLSGAIINYERALKLAPGDSDIHFNLNLAKTHLVDKIEELPDFFLKRWINSVSSIFTSNQWAFISIAGFLLLLISVLVFIFSKSTAFRKLVFLFSLLFISFTIASGFFSWKQMRLIKDKSSAIITVPLVVVKSSPDEYSADLFILHEGTKITVKDVLGQWRQIRISDGQQGWIKDSAFEVI